MSSSGLIQPNRQCRLLFLLLTLAAVGTTLQMNRLEPEQCVAELRHICLESAWERLPEIRRRVGQKFVTELDADGMTCFWAEVLRLGLSKDLAEAVRITDTRAFQAGLASAFETAARKLAGASDIKGIYFEYFVDGGDSCTGDVFLCTAYSSEDDDWASQFDKEGWIEGPSVSEFFRYDLDGDWDDFSRVIADEYANGRVMAIVLQEWMKSKIRELPFGLAGHDDHILRVPGRALRNNLS